MINPAEDNCKKQCGPNETKPSAITINSRHVHNNSTNSLTLHTVSRGARGLYFLVANATLVMYLSGVCNM